MSWNIVVRTGEVKGPPIPLEWVLVGAGILVATTIAIYYEVKGEEELMLRG